MKFICKPFGPFYRPKWQISLRFYILQLVNSLPFYIPEAWKRYAFPEEPPRIGRHREHPFRDRPLGDAFSSVKSTQPWLYLLTSVPTNLATRRPICYLPGTLIALWSFPLSLQVLYCETLARQWRQPMSNLCNSYSRDQPVWHAQVFIIRNLLLFVLGLGLGLGFIVRGLGFVGVRG